MAYKLVDQLVLPEARTSAERKGPGNGLMLAGLDMKAESHKQSLALAAKALRILNSILLGDQCIRIASNTLPTFASMNQGVILVNSVVGSYGLHVWDALEPVRCSVTGTPSENTFYGLARGRIHRDGADLLTILSADKKALNMFELGIEGIRFVLQYYQVPYSTFGRIPNISALSLKPGNRVSLATTEKAKIYHHTVFLCQQIHDQSVFRAAYLSIKTWARLHGIYSEQFRYLAEPKLLIMVAMVYSQDIEATSEQLIHAFFKYWRRADANKVHKFPSARHSATLSTKDGDKPFIRFADFTTKSTMRRIDACIDSEHLSHFSEPFDPVKIETKLLSATGFDNFKRENRLCVKIDIQYWGPSRIGRDRFFAYMHSAVAELCFSFDHMLSYSPWRFRVWPERILDTRLDNGEEDVALSQHVCYLIGSGYSFHGPQEVFEGFRTSIQSSPFYDPSTAFIDIVEDNSVEKPYYILDPTPWPLFPQEPNADDSDEVDEETATTDPQSKAKSNRRAKVQAKTHPSGPSKPQAKLRPASDVLNRILHDPSLAPDDYSIGYLDRHAGIMEMPLTKWKIKDATDEEFIPQSRIRFFKHNGDIVWDREEKFDRVFGSGVNSTKKMEQGVIT